MVLVIRLETEPLKAQFSSAEEFRDKIVKKIIPVQGDITMDLLGLSGEDLATRTAL